VPLSAARVPGTLGHVHRRSVILAAAAALNLVHCSAFRARLALLATARPVMWALVWAVAVLTAYPALLTLATVPRFAIIVVTDVPFRRRVVLGFSVVCVAATLALQIASGLVGAHLRARSASDEELYRTNATPAWAVYVAMVLPLVLAYGAVASPYVMLRPGHAGPGRRSNLTGLGPDTVAAAPAAAAAGPAAAAAAVGPVAAAADAGPVAEAFAAAPADAAAGPAAAAPPRFRYHGRLATSTDASFAPAVTIVISAADVGALDVFPAATTAAVAFTAAAGPVATIAEATGPTAALRRRRRE
jgi:hypothetical protein